MAPDLAAPPPLTSAPGPSQPAQGRPTVRLSDRGRGLLAAGITVTLLAVPLGFVDLIRLGMVVALLPLLARVTAQRHRFRAVVARDVDPADITVGEDATVALRVADAVGRPLPSLLAEEQLDAELGEPFRTFLPGRAAGQPARVEYPIRPRRRGRHRLGPLTLHARDPFGLALVVLTVPARTEIVALPPVHRLEGGAAGRGIGTEGATPAIVLDHGPEDASIRSYLEGDDLRKIHWPVTAHRGELMVRHEGRPTLRRALLVLDTALFPRVPGIEGGLDWAVELLASVAAHLGAAGYSVHLLTPRTVGIHGPNGLTSLPGILHELALTEPLPVAPSRFAPLPELESGNREPPRGGRSSVWSGTGSRDPHAQLLGTVRDAAAAGGLLVSVATDHDDLAVQQLLQTRPHGSAGLLLVLDSAAGAVPSTRCTRTVDLARAAGWVAAPVVAGTTVQAAWRQLLAGDESVTTQATR